MSFMQYIYLILYLVVAYLLGSIPTSVWVGKWFYNKDIREYGSKNAGASNTFRVLGVRAGIPVLIVDVLKGWCAVKLAVLFPLFESASNQFVLFSLALGIAAVIGHIFPVYVGFKGGKGVATMLGITLALLPYPALVSIGVYIVVLLSTRYPSLSSMSGGIVFPFAAIFIFKTKFLSLVIFSIVAGILLLITHRKNIIRLINHQEPKANLYKKRT